MKLSVVIPAHNEEQNIKATLDGLLATINAMTDIKDFEIIVVDDHSSDNTFDIVKKMNDSRVSCIRLSRRSGSHIAIRAGLRESNGDVALCISADGQEDISCIKLMLNKWHNGAKIIWALRKNRKDEPWQRRISAQLFYIVLRWFVGNSKNNIDVSRADFFLLDQIVVKALNQCLERNTSIFGLIFWLGFNQDYVEYKRTKRRFGKSKWYFSSLLRLSKDWLIAFSDLPLTTIFFIGLIIILISFLSSLYLVISLILGRNIQVVVFFTIVLAFLCGLILIAISFLGEYLMRCLDEARGRPLFFIEKKT